LVKEKCFHSQKNKNLRNINLKKLW
jgi:hypothetical protein